LSAIVPTYLFKQLQGCKLFGKHVARQETSQNVEMRQHS